MKLRWLSSLGLILAALAPGALAQTPFVIQVVQGPRAFTVANGGTVPLAATAIGSEVRATIRLTFIGSTEASFPSAPQVTGSPEITLLSPGPSSMLPGNTASLEIAYRPEEPEGALAQFSLPFVVAGAGATVPPTSGAILLTLNGTVPFFAVSYVQPVDNNTEFVPNGGAIRFPQSILNTALDTTLTISNRGSGPGRLLGMSLEGQGFQLLGLPLFPITVPPASELRVTLRFFPRTLGELSAVLRVRFESGDFSANVTGESLRSFFRYEVIGEAGPVAIEPGAPIILPSVPLGDRSSLLVRVTNNRALPASLTVVTVTNTSFVLSELPPLPLFLQPGDATTFRLSFRPTEADNIAAFLVVNNDTFPVRSTGLGAQLRLFYTIGGVEVPLSGNTIFFPPAAPREKQTALVRLENRGTSQAQIVTIGVTDPRRFFRLVNLPALPAVIAAGASTSFAVEFEPTAPGQATATLTIDNNVLNLSGFTEDVPALPGYRFTGASGTQEPFTQPAIGLSLNQSYPVEIRGTLELSVVAELFAIDPAVQFSTGGQSVPFRIPANSLDAIFPNGGTQIRLQTGTVAAQLVVTPTFSTANGLSLTPDNPAVLRLTVPSRPPVLLGGRVSARSNTSLSILVNGFASSRSLQRMELQFTPREGRTLDTTQLTVDLTAESRLWFQSAASLTAGGQFSIEMPFSLSGGATNPPEDVVARIDTIRVRVTNELGNSNEITIVVP
jgi:hypothetical protein